MPIPPGGQDDVAGLMDGYLRTQLLYVTGRLGLADSLTNGPQSAPGLAAALADQRSALEPWCSADCGGSIIVDW